MVDTTQDYDQLLKKDRQYIIHGFHSAKDVKDAIIFTEAKGVILKDKNNNEYIDTIGGGFNMHLGHCRPELSEIASLQMNKFEMTLLLPALSNVPAILLGEKIVTIAQRAFPNFVSTYFTNGGGEANDAAFHLALKYHACNNNLSKKKIISLKNCYHGSTFFTISLNPEVDEFGWKRINEGSYNPFVTVPFAHQNCMDPKKMKEGETIGQAAARIFEETVKSEGPDTIAAFIFEPIQGDGGMIIPPNDYFPLVREICDKYNILMIADEVMTFGKTGKWFAMEHFNTTPDIITIAKGISSGYLPVGAVLVSEKIKKTVLDRDDKWKHDYTYSGHAVGLAIALKTLEIFESENLIARAETVGQTMLRIFQEKLSGFSLVKAIRGAGVMCAVEFTEPIAKDLESMAFEEHLIMHSNRSGNCLNMAPPIIITDEQITKIADGIANMLKKKGDRK